MPAAPLTRYRVVCGRKVHTPWLHSMEDARRAAVRLDLALLSDRGTRINLGPLTWIEQGAQPYVGRKITPLRSGLDGRPLPLDSIPIYDRLARLRPQPASA